MAQSPLDAANWLECNGQPTSGYPELAAVIGAAVPDLRGKFLRGLGGNSAALGVAQGDAIRNITGSITGGGVVEEGARATGALELTDDRYAGAKIEGLDYGLSFDASRQVPTANENRPVNMAVRYLIRARP